MTKFYLNKTIINPNTNAKNFFEEEFFNKMASKIFKYIHLNTDYISKDKELPINDKGFHYKDSAAKWSFFKSANATLGVDSTYVKSGVGVDLVPAEAVSNVKQNKLAYYQANRTRKIKTVCELFGQRDFNEIKLTILEPLTTTIANLCEKLLLQLNNNDCIKLADYIAHKLLRFLGSEVAIATLDIQDFDQLIHAIFSEVDNTDVTADDKPEDKIKLYPIGLKKMGGRVRELMTEVQIDYQRTQAASNQQSSTLKLMP